MQKDKWKIYIAGYGMIDFLGTEEEAEDARIRKSRAEHAIAVKYRLENQTTLDKLQELKVWFFQDRRSCPSFVFTQIRNFKKGKLR